MGKVYYYVLQHNKEDKSTTLLGFNLTEVEKNKLFYSLGKNENSASGNKLSDDEHLKNSYGGHKKKLKNADLAFDELVTKPQEFNKAIQLLEKKGFAISKKSNVHPKLRTLSYQMEGLGAWK